LYGYLTIIDGNYITISRTAPDQEQAATFPKKRIEGL